MIGQGQIMEALDKFCHDDATVTEVANGGVLL